jgi:membrane glycosyltransferase
MGQGWYDQYSLLHFATGIFAYFWGFSWIFTLVAHIVFEIVENTQLGMEFINNKIPWWPGGKPKADSIPNQISDTIMTMLGWYASRYADSLSEIYHLYPG